MPKFFQAIHLPIFEVDNNNNMKWIMELKISNDWINKSIGFFVPIFLYQLGQSTNLSWFNNLVINSFQKGVFLIAIYYAYMRFLVFLTSIPLGQIVGRFGTRISLLLNLFFQIGFYLFLLLSRHHIGFLIVAGFFEAVQIFLLNTIYLTLFSLFSLKKHLGTDLSLTEFLVQMVGVAIPALSGVIIVKFGFDSLFLLGLVGVLSNLIIILSMDSITFKTKPSWFDFQKWIKNLSNQKNMWAYAGRYFHDAALSIWPIYILLLVGTLDRVGFIYSMSLFFSMIILFFSGIYFDHKKNKKPFYLSGGILSVLWIARMMVNSTISIIFVDTIDKLTSSIHWLFFDAISISQSKKDRALFYFTYRELVMSFCGSFFWLLIIGFFFFPANWNSLFLLGAVGIILSLLIDVQNNKV